MAPSQTPNAAREPAGWSIVLSAVLSAPKLERRGIPCAITPTGLEVLFADGAAPAAGPVRCTVAGEAGVSFEFDAELTPHPLRLCQRDRACAHLRVNEQAAASLAQLLVGRRVVWTTGFLQPPQWDPTVEFLPAPSPEQLERRLGRELPGALLLGPSADPRTVDGLIQTHGEGFFALVPAVVLTHALDDEGWFPHLEGGRLRLVLPTWLHPAALRDALASVLCRVPSAAAPGAGAEVSLEGVFALTRRLARTPLDHRFGASVVEQFAALLGADGAECLAVEDATLLGAPGREPQAISTGHGCAAVALRRDRPLLVSASEESLRRDPALGGTHAAHALVLAIRSATDRPLAVLCAWRQAGRPPFGAAEAALSRGLGAQLSTFFTAFVEKESPRRLAARLQQAALHPSDGAEDFELLPALALLPKWINRMYLTLTALAVLGVIAAWVAPIHEYAHGPAVIRIENQYEVPSAVEGVVMKLEVTSGEEVKEGQVLVRLFDEREVTELERATEDFEAALIALMLSPGNPGARDQVASLSGLREGALRRLQARRVRAPRAGTITQLRVRPGQELSPGDRVASLETKERTGRILAILPGQFRPYLEPGTRLQIELDGFPYQYQYLTLDTVWDEVVGPAEARRYLGKEIGDTLQSSGPVTIAEGRLESQVFRAHGEEYRYHDGMQGKAEVKVRSERAIFALIPGLRALGRGSE